MMELKIEYIGGLCPVQAEGTIGDRPFYFRARGNTWAIYIAEPGGNPLDYKPYKAEIYGETPDAGYMPETEVREVLQNVANELSEEAFRNKSQ